ncbi:hypothetical protein [Chitinophaga flava]|nr:hypothetical protein [Chitinophaga flava]
MIKNLLIVALLAVAVNTYAQQTAPMKKSAQVGAYGTFSTGFTSVSGHLSVITGVSGGIFLNKKFMIGAGGYTMANMIKINKTGIDRNWHIWYTGGVFEYVHHSDKKFHWTAGTLIGGGSLSERLVMEDEKDKDKVVDRYGFFVVEPFINAELNINQHIRLFAAGKYRQIMGAGSGGLSNGGMSAPGLYVGIKAGRF